MQSKHFQSVEDLNRNQQFFAKCMIVTSIIIMDILGGTEFDLFVPSFPQLQSHFGLSIFWIEASLSINFIGYCLSLFFIGNLADNHGRRPIIVWGLIIFTFGSLLCLWGFSYPFFLMGRFLQGIGIAAPATLSFLIIADSYPLQKQQSLMGILNGLMNLSTGIAPVIGSYIALYFHWQGNFIALLILGLISLVMTFLFIPTYKLPEHKETLSLKGYAPLFQSKPLMLLVIHFIFMWMRRY